MSQPTGKIAVIDYGMGNLRSVWQALVHVAKDREIIVTSDPREVANAERIVFPGQGAMPDCMKELEARGLREAVIKAAAEKPFLGICIGLQMLFEHSEEGNVPGLGILKGKVKRFPADKMLAPDGNKLKVPHMGWNEVQQVQPHKLWANIDNGARYYFVHSYFVEPDDSKIVAGQTLYGIPFTSAVAKDNIFATQCHPEKSANIGLSLLANFIDWQP